MIEAVGIPTVARALISEVGGQPRVEDLAEKSLAE